MTLYLSGQIGLDPYSMELVEGIEAQIRRVFDNLKAVWVGLSKIFTHNLVYELEI
jgi:enamine deaminase RidA (YjgF/YER057c/UK114 family)